MIALLSALDSLRLPNVETDAHGVVTIIKGVKEKEEQQYQSILRHYPIPLTCALFFVPPGAPSSSSSSSSSTAEADDEEGEDDQVRVVIVSDPGGTEEDLLASLSSPGDCSDSRLSRAWFGVGVGCATAIGNRGDGKVGSRRNGRNGNGCGATGWVATVFIDEEGHVCGFHKPGSAVATCEELEAVMKRGGERVSEVLAAMGISAKI